MNEEAAAAPEAKPKASRKRTKREYVVLDKEGEVLSVRKRGFPSSEKAKRWIRSSGLAKQQYQVGCLIGEVVTVEVETVEKRSLT